MDSPMKQAAKLMQAKKGGNRKLALFLCLALLVTAGTVTAFVLHAQAQNHTRRVLACAYEVHEHTEDCYPGGNTHADPVCGLADFVVHKHNDDCYDEFGELVCDLEEIEEHEHDEDCYTAPLICELKEGPGHTHTAAECYGPAEGAVPVCGQEEREATPGVPGHVHTAECYTAGDPQLACGLAEGEGAAEGSAGHSHSEGCYNEDGEQVCGLSEGEGAVEAVPGHTHSDACYETPSVLSCGIEEGAGAVEADPGHTHTGECYAKEDLVLTCTADEYEPHTHTEECYGDPKLTCKKKEIILHTHSEEDDCYDPLTEEEKKLDPVPEHGALICEDLQIEEHTHNELCFITETLTAEEVAELEHEAQPKVEDLQLVYEDENIRVLVDYDTNSRLPGEGMGIALISADTPAPELALSQMAVLTEKEKDDGDEADPAGESDPADETDPAGTDPAGTDPAGTETAGTETAEGEPAEGEEEAGTSAPETPEAEAPETGTPAAPETGDAENTEDAPQDEAVFDLVRAGLVDEDGREWLPAATVTYTVQYLLDGELAGDPVQYHYTPGGMLPCFLRSIETFTQTVETDEFIVTARYTALAQIGDAVLYAAPITDEEAVADYTAQYREAVNSSRAQMHVLMDIGFGLNGEEIQPAAPVEITVQLKGEDGLPAGEPLTVVHFGAEGNDVIAAKADEAGAAAFKMNSFSPVGIGQTPESDDEGRALLDEQNGTFEWTDPNGLYHITFRVNGVIAPMTEDGEEPEDGEQGDGEQDAAAPEEGEDAGAPGEDEEAAGEDEDGETEEAAAPETDTTDIPLATAGLLNFNVELLGEDDEAYIAYASATQVAEDELFSLSVMRYSLTYGDTEMDLSGCEIIATIAPTMQLQAMSEAYAEENRADNGDDDGDGYVLGADGETLLPAPVINTNLTFSVMAPSEEDGELVAVRESIQLDGASAAPAEDAPADEEAPAEDEIASANPTSAVFAPFSAASLGADMSGSIVSALGVRPIVPDHSIFQVNPLAAANSGQKTDLSVDSSQAFDVDLTASNPDEAVVYTVAAKMQGKTNPSFTVQYYANLNVIAESGAHALTVIDTSGGVLPKNGGDYKDSPTGRFRSIYVDGSGNVQYEPKKIEVYASKQYEFQRAPELIYTEILFSNPHYALYPQVVTNGNVDRTGELWVLRAGMSEDAAKQSNENDWFIYNITGIDTTTVEVNGVDYTRTIYTAYLAKDPNRTPLKLSFTNSVDFTEPSIPNESDITYIPLNSNTVLRWVYYSADAYGNDSVGGYPVSAAFYDYDISTGKIYRAKPNDPFTYTNYMLSNQVFDAKDNLTQGDHYFGQGKPGVLTWAAGLTNWDGHIYAYTRESGINSSGNYSGSGEKFAFGNVNTGTNLGRRTWSNNGTNTFNKYNNNGYRGCTFGLVTGLSDGKVQYASGIQAPKLFNEGRATGKESYDDGQFRLVFSQEGDTYTLISVQQKDGNTYNTVLPNLDRFTNPSNSQGIYDGQHNGGDGKRLSAIWTNNFWPMDHATSFGSFSHDVKFGASITFKTRDESYDKDNDYFNVINPVNGQGTHQIRFGPMTQKPNDSTDTGDFTFPESDDGLYHNSYFGMHYEVKFTLDKEYIGPLEYYFFGDDDMWVFLDGKLVCDIGGVHSSVGEYVNLWDHIDGGKEKHAEGDHTLSVFYTERGASGSTCWTQFTLPKVEEIVPDKTPEDYGSLKIGKTVTRFSHEGDNDPEKTNDDNGDVFTFLINITYMEVDKTPNQYIGYLYRGNDTTPYGQIAITNNGIFTLKNNEYIVIKDLPVGTSYTVTEISAATSDNKPSNTVYETEIIHADGTETTDVMFSDGNIVGNTTREVKFNNMYHVYKLPKTGGMPAIVYTGAGAMLVMLAAAAWTLRKRRSKAADASAK